MFFLKMELIRSYDPATKATEHQLFIDFDACAHDDFHKRV